MFFLLANPCIEYVCCVCDSSVCLGVPSICQMCMFVRDVISEFNLCSDVVSVFYFVSYVFWE